MRIKPVDGELWFVPSTDGAGGCLVNVVPPTGAARCSCPDAQRGTKCKHVWAVEAVRAALPSVDGGAIAQAAPPRKPPPKGDLTPEEQGHVRAALKFLRARHGWPALAKGMRYEAKTVKEVAYGRLVTASVAVRLARFSGVGVDDVILGRFPPLCPHCNQRMP